MRVAIYILFTFIISSCKNNKELPIVKYNSELLDLCETGNEMQSAGKFDSALIVYENIISENPDFLPAYTGKRFTLAKLFEYDTLLLFSESMANKFPTSEAVLFEVGALHLKKGNYNKSKEYFKKCITCIDKILNSGKIKYPNRYIRTRALAKKAIGDRSYLKDINLLERTPEDKMENMIDSTLIDVIEKKPIIVFLNEIYPDSIR